jgi:septal ring factor EnvC (AmiA/AmiB activator)
VLFFARSLLVRPGTTSADQQLAPSSKDARATLAAAAEEQERLQADVFKHKALLSRTENDLLRVEQQLQSLREVKQRLEDAQLKLDGLRQELKVRGAATELTEVSSDLCPFAPRDSPRMSTPVSPRPTSRSGSSRPQSRSTGKITAMRYSSLRRDSVPSSSRRRRSVRRPRPSKSACHVGSLRVCPDTESLQRMSARWDQDEGPRRLREVEDEVEEKQQLIESSRSELAELDGRVKALEADFHQADKRRNTLEANLRHRQYKARIRQAKEEIKALPVEESSEAREKYDCNYGKSKQKEQELISQVLFSIAR